MKIRTMLQGFEWYVPADGKHWNRIAAEAERLSRLGFTDIWLPPAYKGLEGANDVGYGVYDLFDLGEFDQKGTVATKYGTKDEYLAAIRALHQANIRVLADVVLNHMMGNDSCSKIKAHMVDPGARISGKITTKVIKAPTVFKFSNRRRAYSAFKWNEDHFLGVDINEKKPDFRMPDGSRPVYKFVERRWPKDVDEENENYAYLMGADIDHDNPVVKAHLMYWGMWYQKFADLDGFRIDAVKHISANFYKDWLNYLRMETGKELFSVGEYWSSKLDRLLRYLEQTDKTMSLFDVPLHQHLYDAAREGRHYDLRNIFNDTLVAADPWRAVTFVDNHDTQPTQMLVSWVQDWFKLHAYALILLRQEGFPCVFYGDLYGIPKHRIKPVKKLERLLEIRQKYADGEQRDYFNHKNRIAWTRGDSMVVVMSNTNVEVSDSWNQECVDDGEWIQFGKPGQVFLDVLGNRLEEVIVNDNGWAKFLVGNSSVSIWVPKEQY